MTDAPPPQPTIGATFKRLGPTGLVGLYFSVMPLLGLAVLGWNLQHVTEFFAAHKDAAGLAVYGWGFALLSGLALLPTWPQSLIGGWAFGLVWGIPAAVVAVTIGSLVGSEIARAASGHRVEKIIDEHAKWRVVRDALIGRGFWKTLGMVTLVRMPPNSPFAITNLVLGAVRVPRGINALGTMIGIIPRTAVTVYLGTTIKKLSSETLTEGPPKWLFVAGLIAMMVVVGVIGVVAKRALAGMVKEHEARGGK